MWGVGRGCGVGGDGVGAPRTLAFPHLPVQAALLSLRAAPLTGAAWIPSGRAAPPRPRTSAPVTSWQSHRLATGHTARPTRQPRRSVFRCTPWCLRPHRAGNLEGRGGGGGRRWVGQDGGARKQAARQGSLYEEPVMMWHDTPDDTHGPRVGQRNIKLN